MSTEEKKTEEKTTQFSCVDCAVTACRYGKDNYPQFCPTKAMSEEYKASVLPLYNDGGINAKYAFWSATVEGTYYGEMARVEETMEFARRVGARKLGLACCSELRTEAELYAKILDTNGFETYMIDCHASSLDAGEVMDGTASGEKMCDPVTQAKLLNEAGVDMNILLGLCAGSDALFIKHAEAMTTIMINKDRLTGNNPAVTLYRPERRKLV